MESFCCRLARLLTDQENHRTQTEYEAAFLWKAQDSFVGTFFEKNVEKLQRHGSRVLPVLVHIDPGSDYSQMFVFREPC